jgi:hypothetical protein
MPLINPSGEERDTLPVCGICDRKITGGEMVATSDGVFHEFCHTYPHLYGPGPSDARIQEPAVSVSAVPVRGTEGAGLCGVEGPDGVGPCMRLAGHEVTAPNPNRHGDWAWQHGRGEARWGHDPTSNRVTVQVPVVHAKAVGETDAMRYRVIAGRIRSDMHLGGSSSREAVASLLEAVAAQLNTGELS